MITEKDVRYIASLSRIHLRTEEVEELTKNLEKILQFVAKLEKADVSNVEATSHVLPLKNVFREDVVKPSLGQKDALKIAVEEYNGFFKVPKVIE
jgi:aspartyl-tRNA(Asn)/glutamyl-tRNA(Gln) amidotransferase subunit C